MDPVVQPATTTALQRAPLYALFAANAISAVGDVLTFLAIPWFVLQTTGSITKTGITAFFATASIALSAFFGSALVDRLGYKRASVVSDLLSAAGVAGIPLLYALGRLAFWELLALVFLAGLFTTPGGTARAALVPDLAERARMRLERVSAATDGTTRISSFIGAPLAGVLIAFTGTSNLLWIDAATFVVSAAMIGLAVPALRPMSAAVIAQAAAPVRGVRGRVRVYLADISQGARFIWRDHLILSIIGVIMVTNLLDAAYGSVLAPVFIKRVFGNAIVLGGLVAALGGAAFLGTVVFGAIGHRLPRRLTLGVSYTIGGGTRFLALALIPFVPALLAIQAVSGFFIGAINPLVDTVAYERIPVGMRARVFGTITAGAMMGTPLGGLVSGYCAVWIGIQPTLIIFGLIYLATTLSLLVNPALRGMEATRKSV
jgi:MFS family permease